MRYINISFKVNNQKIKVPKDAQKGHICPYRSDIFQGNCWNCDFCGRNEASEHGISFPTVEISGFHFYKENISNQHMVGDEFIFEYGNKIIFIDIHSLPEWCEMELKDIWIMIEELSKNNIVEDPLIYYDGHDYVKHRNTQTIFYINGRTWTWDKLNDEEAVICLISDTYPTQNKIKSFIDLINYQNEETLTLNEWEDIYGYDI